VEARLNFAQQMHAGSASLHPNLEYQTSACTGRCTQACDSLGIVGRARKEKNMFDNVKVVLNRAYQVYTAFNGMSEVRGSDFDDKWSEAWSEVRRAEARLKAVEESQASVQQTQGGSAGASTQITS
jgi:hypothetical protein